MIKAFYLALFVVSFLFIHLDACAQAILPDFDATGWELPVGVPRVVDTNGNVIFVDTMFTTPAFQEAALRLVIAEANQVAKEMRLSENLPIMKTNLIHAFVGPFGFTYAYKKVGNITTTNYFYGVEQDNKFSDLTLADLDNHCFQYKRTYNLLTNQIDFAGAFQLATQWLNTLHMDVKGLNRDCEIKLKIDEYWNGLQPNEKLRKKSFVPIYDISWLSTDRHLMFRGKATIQLFLPTKTLLQLSVNDSKYILRQPVVFTNLAALFPGKATIRTNWPVKPQFGPPPGTE